MLCVVPYAYVVCGICVCVICMCNLCVCLYGMSMLCVCMYGVCMFCLCVVCVCGLVVVACVCMCVYVRAYIFARTNECALPAYILPEPYIVCICDCMHIVLTPRHALA